MSGSLLRVSTPTHPGAAESRCVALPCPTPHRVPQGVLSRFNVVVMTDRSMKELLSVNAICHRRVGATTAIARTP